MPPVASRADGRPGALLSGGRPAALDMPIGSIGPTGQRCLERLRRYAEANDLLSMDTMGGATS